MADQSNLKFTGERIVPQALNCEPNFAQRMYQEHIVRYLFAAQLVEGKKVIDIGCGVGYGSRRLAEMGAESVYALDLSEDAIGHAKVHYAHPKITYKVDSAEDFFVKKKFDVAVCFELIEHVNHAERVLNRIARILKPDGILIMSTPRALDKKRTHFHTHEFTFGEYEDLLLRHFKNVRMYVENNHFVSLVTGGAPSAVNRIELINDQFDVGVADVFIAVAALSAETELPELEPVLAVNDDAYVRMLERDVEILHKAEDDLRDQLEVTGNRHSEIVNFKEAEIDRLKAEYQALFDRHKDAHNSLYGELQTSRAAGEALKREIGETKYLLGQKEAQLDEANRALSARGAEAQRLTEEVEGVGGVALQDELASLTEENTSLKVRLTDVDERRLEAFEFARSVNDQVYSLRNDMDRLRREIARAVENPSDFISQSVSRDHRHRDVVEAMARLFPGVDSTQHLARDPLAASVAAALEQRAEEVRTLKAEVDRLIKEYNILFAKGQAESGDPKAALEAAGAVRERQSHDIAQLRHRAEMAELRASEARIRMDGAGEVVRQMRLSASWRLTAPLRGASVVFGRPTLRLRNAVRHLRVHGLGSTLAVAASRLMGRSRSRSPSRPAPGGNPRNDGSDSDGGGHSPVVSRIARVPDNTDTAKAEIFADTNSQRQPHPRVLDVIMLIGCWEGESKRYRVHNVAAALAKDGLSVKVMDFSQGHEILAEQLTARTLLIFRSPFEEGRGVERLVDYARQRGMRLVFDIDDLVFEPELVPLIHGVKELSPEDQESYMRGVMMYRRMLLACDMVTVTTPPLKRAVEKLGKTAAIIPNCLNTDQIELAEVLLAMRKPNARTVVGYFPGSRTHQRDFAEVESALLELMAERDDWDFMVVGFLDLGLAWEPYLHRVRRQGFIPYLDMLRVLSECDVNIAPLEVGDAFCEAKSELKFFEAGLVCTPTIASPTEPFANAVTSGVNGYLAVGADDWKANLRALLDSEPRRHEMGQAARATALEMFGPQANASAAKAAYFGDMRAPQVPRAMPAKRSNAVVSQKLKIDWIVPRLIIGGGGHRNIIRAAYHLERFGHDVVLHFTSSDDQASQLPDLVRRNFYDFKGKVRTYDGEFRESDVIIATHWSTVDAALRVRDRTREVMYFVQDFEPAFAPMGTEYVMAENTYRQGLYCITSGPWCERVLKDQYACEADHFRFPVDVEVYRPRPRTKKNRNIIFFAKPEMPRRCFELGVRALEHFHRLRPDVEVLMFGSSKAKDHPVGFPAKYLEIVPTLEDLATLYSNADLGIAFSLTNPSLVPYEMMAGGCPVVDLRRPGNEYNYDNRYDIAFLADPRPEKMAEEIALLLDDPAQLAVRRDKGLAFTREFPDELGMARRVEELILARMQRHR